MLVFEIPPDFGRWPLATQLREFARQLDDREGSRRLGALLVEAATEIELAEWRDKRGDLLPGAQAV